MDKIKEKSNLSENFKKKRLKRAKLIFGKNALKLTFGKRAGE